MKKNILTNTCDKWWSGPFVKENTMKPLDGSVSSALANQKSKLKQKEKASIKPVYIIDKIAIVYALISSMLFINYSKPVWSSIASAAGYQHSRDP